MLALQVFRDGTPPSRPIRDWIKVYIAWWQGLTNRLPSLVWGCFLTRISFCLRRKQSKSSRNHDLNFTMRCSRPRFFVAFEFQVCPEPYLSLEDNFIFIADHEPYSVDVDKKGKNTKLMRTGLITAFSPLTPDVEDIMGRCWRFNLRWQGWQSRCLS